MIYIGSDQAGYLLKQGIIQYFKKNNIVFEDIGCYSLDAVKYPDVAAKMAQKLQENKEAKGLLMCGSGIGMSVAANKYEGIKAGNCYNEQSAILAVEHVGCNVLCLAGLSTSIQDGIKITKTFLSAKIDPDYKDCITAIKK